MATETQLASFPWPTYAGILLIFSTLVYRYLQARYRAIVSITNAPVIGASGYFSSFLNAILYFFRWSLLLKTGYQSQNDIFQIPTQRGFLTFVSSHELIEELCMVPENVLSLMKPFSEEMQTEYLVPGVFQPAWVTARLIKVVRETLKDGSIPYDQLENELQLVLNDELIGNTGWSKTKTMDFSIRIVSRVISRAFVGLPLCRDPTYLECVISYAKSLALSAQILKLFPRFMKPYIARKFIPAVAALKKGEEYILPVVQRTLAEYNSSIGEHKGAPANDILRALIVDALATLKKGVNDLDVRLIARELFIVNTAAIHTSAQTATMLFYEMTNHPEYIPILRQEARDVISANAGHLPRGALDDLKKLDSFMKEALRHNPPGIVTLYREARRPFTFSNGLRLPVGGIIATPTSAINMDERLYPDPKRFDGLRFYGEERVVDTSPSSLVFGHGVHACPGRFLATGVLKLFIAHMVIDYDLRPEKEGKRPKNLQIQGALTPNIWAKIFVKKVKTS